jgi:hypothetical protein
MSEAEFDRVMEAVGTAITTSDFNEAVQAANENEEKEIVEPLEENGYPVQSSPGPIPGNTEFLLLLLGRLSAEGPEPPPLIR